MLDAFPTWSLVVALLLLMLAANELGYRAGQRYQWSETEQSRTVSGAFKGSILGLVALLLGFSFSATTNRYEVRQRIVIDQANALGTCYQRAGMLSALSREPIRSNLRAFLVARLALSDAGAEDSTRYQKEIDRCLADLWLAVEDAYRREPENVRNCLIVPAANEVIDLSSTRAWANRNHLPAPVLVLLVVSVLVSCMLFGHSSGQAGRRHVGLWLASNAIFALVVYIVLDFDMPRRGLIQVDVTALVELKAGLGLTVP